MVRRRTVGFNDSEFVGASGRERKQLPAGQELALAIEAADAANGQAPIAEGGFGDLGDARGG